MIIFVVINIIVFLILLVYYWTIKSNNIVREKIISDKENQLINHINDYNGFVDTYDSFYKNKTYQLGMGYLHLKKFQQDLLEVLDPVIDAEMIVRLHTNINQIDDTLKELSFLSKNTLKISKGKMIDPIYFDKSVFSKN